MKPLTKGQIEGVISWLNKWEQLLNTAIPLRFREDFTALIPKRRSISANNLYWLWLTCLEDMHGQDKNDFHDLFKSQFIGTKTKQVFDRVILKEPSTKNLDTKQFNQYMTKVQAESATEWDTKLPLPEDLGFSDFVDKYEGYL